MRYSITLFILPFSEKNLILELYKRPGNVDLTNRMMFATAGTFYSQFFKFGNNFSMGFRIPLIFPPACWKPISIFVLHNLKP